MGNSFLPCSPSSLMLLKKQNNCFWCLWLELFQDWGTCWTEWEQQTLVQTDGQENINLKKTPTNSEGRTNLRGDLVGNEPEQKIGVLQNQQCKGSEGKELGNCSLFFVFTGVFWCWWWFYPDCFISWLGLTYFLQKSLARIKETSVASAISPPKGAGHSSSHGAESRSFEPTLISSISKLIKPSSSTLPSSSYSKIPKSWLCQTPSLEFKAFMGEETF